jgi:hypothetical protein
VKAEEYVAKAPLPLVVACSGALFRGWLPLSRACLAPAMALYQAFGAQRRGCAPGAMALTQPGAVFAAGVWTSGAAGLAVKVGLACKDA